MSAFIPNCLRVDAEQFLPGVCWPEEIESGPGKDGVASAHLIRPDKSFEYIFVGDWVVRVHDQAFVMSERNFRIVFGDWP